jgi:septum formation protein
MMLLYLASQSSRRRLILKKMKIPFRVVKSAYIEKNIPGLPPGKLVRIHAEGKARKARLRAGARFVLGADTVVVFRGRVLGKPRHREEAVRMLTALQGRSHWVYTGVALRDRLTGREATRVCRTKVLMKKMTAPAISNYLRCVNPLDKAGSYGIQEGPRIVRKVEGSYTNVVGLPVETLGGLLRAFSF